jgi:hypothetical protein
MKVTDDVYSSRIKACLQPTPFFVLSKYHTFGSKLCFQLTFLSSSYVNGSLEGVVVAELLAGIILWYVSHERVDLLPSFN